MNPAKPNVCIGRVARKASTSSRCSSASGCTVVRPAEYEHWLKAAKFSFGNVEARIDCLLLLLCFLSYCCDLPSSIQPISGSDPDQAQWASRSLDHRSALQALSPAPPAVKSSPPGKNLKRVCRR